MREGGSSETVSIFELIMIINKSTNILKGVYKSRNHTFIGKDMYLLGYYMFLPAYKSFISGMLIQLLITERTKFFISRYVS
jgi:hypothetical protein